MAVRSSGYFNSPAFAQAAANLSSLFAPPSGADAAGWATADAKREEAARMAELFTMAGSPQFDQTVFDRSNIAVGNYNPTQSYYAQNQNNATTMRGQDVTAATSLANNAADNRRAALTSLFQPLNQGQVRPELPAELASTLGLPGAIPATEGAAKPLSESEVKGGIIQGMSPELQAAIGFGSTPVESVVTPDGPRIMTRMDAIGQEPFVNQGATAKATNAIAVMPDGTRVPAVQRPGETMWRSAQTSEPLPNGIQVFNLPSPQGSSEDVGLTSATEGRLERQIIELDQTLDTAQKLRNIVASSPSSQGLVGMLRGTAQDVIQTGNDLGQYFGGQIASINQDIQNGLADAGLAENFDPNIPAIQMLTNLLAWQYAKSLSGDRVSNEQLKQARDALGGTGMFANRANTLTRLDQLTQSWAEQRDRLQGIMPSKPLSRTPVSPPAATGTTQRFRFDENGNPL